MTEYENQPNSPSRTAVTDNADHQRAQKYLDIAGVILLALDLRGNVTMLNRKGYELLEYLEGELTGQNWVDTCLPERERSRLFADFKKLAVGDLPSVEYLENWVLTRTGQERLVAWHNSTVFDEAGTSIGTLSSGEDITERRRAEEELRLSEQRQKAILDTIPDPAWLKDREGRLLAVNAAWCRFFGMDAKNFLGKTVFEYFPAGVAEKRWEEDRGTLQSRHSVQLEQLLSDKDGRLVWFETIKSPLFNDHGDVLGITGLARDITARKVAEQEKLEMERRLLHAQKLESIGVLAGGIAHDFNNILAGIMGYADLALAELPACEPARADIEVIKKAVKRAADLTGQMLAYSGKGKFIVEPVDLSRAVEGSKQLLAMSVSKKATLTYNLAADLPIIQADASQMSQVVMNLVINASEALGEQSGTIAVSTHSIRCEAKYLAGIGLGQDLPEGLYVCLDVADTGIGMDAQTIEKIFDPFFTTKFAGRGLGLAAIQGIVRGHSGAIRVSSEPGKGTTFRVLFPASGSTAPAVRSEPVATGGRGAGMILVVDDDETIRTLVQRMIERAGFSVLTASGGREAISLFCKYRHEVRCVLLDLTMPDLDGEETFRELRGIRPDVCVILSSGYSEEATTERFAGKGLAGFIQKPYQLDTLVMQIEKTLGAQASLDLDPPGIDAMYLHACGWLAGTIATRWHRRRELGRDRR